MRRLGPGRCVAAYVALCRATRRTGLVERRVRMLDVLLPRCEGGIGDFLRGAIALHEFCRQRGFITQVDASRHPIGACLSSPVVVDPPEAGVIDVSAPDFPRPILCRVADDLLLKIPVLRPTAVIHSVLWPPWWHALAETPPLPVATRDFLRRFLAPSERMAARVDAVCRAIGNPFVGLHFRCGDGPMMEGKETAPHLLAHAEVVTRRHVADGSTVFVCSDSTAVLRRLRALDHPRVLVSGTVKPLNVHRQMTASDDADDTMADLFTLLRATAIESHSVYPWGSGFIQWPSLIAGVPYSLKVVPAG